MALFACEGKEIPPTHPMREKKAHRRGTTNARKERTDLRMGPTSHGGVFSRGLLLKHVLGWGNFLAFTSEKSHLVFIGTPLLEFLHLCPSPLVMVKPRRIPNLRINDFPPFAIIASTAHWDKAKFNFERSFRHQRSIFVKI